MDDPKQILADVASEVGKVGKGVVGEIGKTAAAAGGQLAGQKPKTAEEIEQLRERDEEFKKRELVILRRKLAIRQQQEAARITSQQRIEAEQHKAKEAEAVQIEQKKRLPPPPPVRKQRAETRAGWGVG